MFSESVLELFRKGSFYEYSISNGQNVTSNNSKFVRFHWELDTHKVGKDQKWRLYAKGGSFRKWYGNLLDTIDWSPEAINFYHKEPSARVLPKELWYKNGITWSLISSNLPGFRFLPLEATFDKGGSSVFCKDEKELYYFLGLLNSKVFLCLAKALNPTVNFQVKDIRSIPVIISNKETVSQLVKECMRISHADWDSFEVSRDFYCHAFLTARIYKLSDTYNSWKQICEERFQQLKSNEEELNRIFIEIYGLKSELTPDVADCDVTVARVFDTPEEIPEFMKGNNYVLTKADVVKSLISYAVGCMLGRYSLDTPGLAYAGGEMDPSKYTSYQPDADNVIPITDEDYFNDDIVGYFVSWMKAAFGPENLEKNLTFVADALGTKGIGSRDKIRTYFLKDFYKDHVKTYKKRPIYWLYDSGKKNGFKALVYMHRYNADTTGRVRMDYLHRMERTYEAEIERMTQEMESGGSAHDIAKARKRRDKLQLQLKECQAYDEQIAQPALARIDIDLDDGVKVNYEKVQTVDGKTYQMLAKVF